MKFSEMKYTRPDFAAVIAQCEAQAEQVKAAKNGEELVRLYRRQDKDMVGYYTMASLANIHFTLDTRDEAWAAEQELFDQNGPAVSNAVRKTYRAYLEHPAAAVLEQTFGETLLAGMRNALAASDERVVELQKEENALSSAYQKLLSSCTVEFDGQVLPLPKLGPYKQSLDRAVRKAAFEAEGKCFDSHREELDEIYDKMIKNRNEQARVMGYHDFSEVSYLRMNRIGYGPAEVAAYREQVAKDIVPVLKDLMELKKKRISLSDAKFYDSALSFIDGNPVPHGTKAELMENARKMYHERSPETAEFIDFMMESDLFDVDSRPGKMAGGYEEMIPAYKAPFIFANWNGTSHDVDVLTHEAGHAFEGWMAARNEEIPSDLACPGMESAEIHSMSMEFLTAPWHHLFFGPDTEKYELEHAEDSIFFLPYGCIVDEFQHIMYQQPDLTPDQRNQVWLQLEHKYRPWNDFGDLPFYSRGAGWQRQLHIYEAPFYYIDYCLAQTIALQFFVANLKDPEDAWQRYLKLVKRAGLDSYAGLVRVAGLRVPFEQGSLHDVALTVADWIRRHQPEAK